MYRPFLDDYFALDDFIWLHAASGTDAGQFVLDALGFPDPTPYSVPTPFWRPLIDGYFFVAWRLWGSNPTPYHIANIATHGANAVLLAVLVRQLTGRRGSALATALLWSVLPSYDIAVLWISEATELLATAAYFGAMVLYTAHLQGGSRSARLYNGALACMVLALLAKQSAVTLPFALAGVSVVVALPGAPAAAVRRVLDLWRHSSY